MPVREAGGRLMGGSGGAEPPQWNKSLYFLGPPELGSRSWIPFWDTQRKSTGATHTESWYVSLILKMLSASQTIPFISNLALFLAGAFIRRALLSSSVWEFLLICIASSSLPPGLQAPGLQDSRPPGAIFFRGWTSLSPRRMRLKPLSPGCHENHRTSVKIDKNQRKCGSPLGTERLFCPGQWDLSPLRPDVTKINEDQWTS